MKPRVRPIDVPCPTCGAEVGKPCRWEGALAKFLTEERQEHHSRIIAARKA
jgi:hypothetical protein